MSGKASDIKAGAAFVELFVKDEKLRAGLRNAKAALQGFGRTLQLAGGLMAGLGAAILAPIGLAVHRFNDWGDQLDKMSQRTGVAASSLAELAHVAQQSGTDIETVEKAMKEMAKNGLDPRRFDEIADEIAAIQDPVLRAQKAMEVWGSRAGTKLLPMLADLKQLRAESRALGGIFTEEQIKLAAELNDAFGRLSTATQNLMMHVGAALAPALITFANAASTAIGFVADIARRFPVITGLVTALGVGLLAAGTALVALGTIAAVVIPSIATLIGVLNVVAAPWLLIGAAIAAVVVYLTALAAIVAAVAAYFLLFTDTGKKVLSTVLTPIYVLLKKFEGLGSAISRSLGLIGKALMAGDIKSAWKALVLGMEAIWHGFLEGVFSSLADFVKWLKEIDPTGDFFGIGRAAESVLRGAAGEQQKKRQALDQQMRDAESHVNKGKSPQDRDYGLPDLRAAAIGFNTRAALMGRQIIGGGRDDRMLDTMTRIAASADKQLRELLEIKNKIPLRAK